jgi:hypothetical protein
MRHIGDVFHAKKEPFWSDARQFMLQSQSQELFLIRNLMRESLPIPLLLATADRPLHAGGAAAGFRVDDFV